ncbi:carbohydrate porin [Acinetobacter sp.]|uniref:carbohydrate porin n=1 Tax=Acinetobacter sp. TaxID=472 RepID=UPI0031D2B67D
MKRCNLMQMGAVSLAILMSQGAMANEFWSQDRQWLLGDWNGERQQLEQLGYKFNFSVMNQTATVLDGGKNDNHQTRNANQVTLGTNFDLNRILGWKNTTAALSVTKRDGRNLANDIGMQGSPTEIYGRGNIWRLTQAWVKTGLFDNTLQVKAGRMGMSEDFNGSQCEFQSLILCGGQVGKSQGDVWYNGPVSGWAMNAKYQFLPEWTIGAGVYENNPENLKTTGEYRKQNFNMDLSDAKGTLIPVELAWKTKKLNGLSGEYKLGGFFSTHDYKRVDGQTGDDPKRAIWLNAQQQLTSSDDNPNRGLYGAVNLVFNNDHTATIESTQQVAMWYKGAFESRPNDQIGLGAGRYKYNDKVAANQNRDDEIDFELNYTLQWSPAIMLRPNIQYIYQPLGNKQADDVWTAGVSVRVNF